MGALGMAKRMGDLQALENGVTLGRMGVAICGTTCWRGIVSTGGTSCRSSTIRKRVPEDISRAASTRSSSAGGSALPGAWACTTCASSAATSMRGSLSPTSSSALTGSRASSTGSSA